MGTMIAGIAAAQLGVSTKTLARWADAGKLRADRSNGNWRIYDAGDVFRLKKRLERRPA